MQIEYKPFPVTTIEQQMEGQWKAFSEMDHEAVNRAMADSASRQAIDSANRAMRASQPPYRP
jgi:hypothetical protein